MTRAFLVLTAMVCLPLTACTYVATKEPLGTPITEKLGAKIEGKWITADGVVFVKYLKEGRVRVAGVSEEKGEFKLNQHMLVVTQMDDTLYTHFAMPDKGTPEKYSLGRLTTVGDGQSMVLHGPRFSVFKKAVESGQLKGEVEDGENVKGATITDKAALEKFLKEHAASELFNIDQPLILTRLGEKKDKKQDK